MPQFAPTVRVRRLPNMPKATLPSSSLLKIVALCSLLWCSNAVGKQAARGAAAGGIDHTNLAIIINAADPLSAAAGDYYAKQRRIPPTQVIRITMPVGSSELSVEEFARVKAVVDALTPSNVQAYVLSWAAPYRVGCMSITSAFAFGYDTSYCADGCRPTRLSPYFNSASRFPALELHV